MKIKFTNENILKIINYYINENLSTSEISKIFNISKTPIIRILKDLNLLREGKSSGIKILLSNEQKDKIHELYLKKYKNSDEIAKEMKLTKSFISKYLQGSGIRRTKSEGASIGLVKRYRNMNYDDYLNKIDDYYKYELEVLRLTRQKPIHELINSDKRGNSGVEGAYHLDHKYSIIEGFKNGVKPELIASINNLEFLPWEENLNKRAKCSITLEELKK